MPKPSRRHGVSENTIYRWKSKFGGMEVTETKRLRELEQESATLKKFLKEAELDEAALKICSRKTGDRYAAASSRGTPQRSPLQ